MAPPKRPVPTDKSVPLKKAFWSKGFETESNSFVDNDSEECVNISALSPGSNCDKFIQGRIVYKSAIREVEGRNGICKVFSFDLMDKSAKVRVTAFGDLASAQYDNIHMNKCIRVKNLKIKQANRLYTPSDIKMEATTSGYTILESIDKNDFPRLTMNFTKLDELESLENGTRVDIAAMVVEVDENQPYVKDGRSGSRRRLKLVDDTNTEVLLTIWAEEAVAYTKTEIHAICIKDVQKTEFENRPTLTACRGTVIWNGPEFKEIQTLENWIKGFKM